MARIDDLEKGLVDCNGEQVVAQIGKDGKEYGDPVPKAPPVGVRRPVPLQDQIRAMVRRELSDRAYEAGYESFEESDDFDIDDDPADPHTPYEAVFDPPPVTKDDDDGRRPQGSAEDPPAPDGERVQRDRSRSEQSGKKPSGERQESRAPRREGGVPGGNEDDSGDAS